MSLTKEQRDALPADHFAVPGKRKLPIHDATHTELAWDMVDRTKDLSDEERSAARTYILHRAKELGIDTKDWGNAPVHALAFHFEAMAVEIPTVEGHPNRMPFKGVLTRVDRPSDEPPGGARGKRVLIPKNVAQPALASLLGMCVDCSDDFDAHNPKQKIGLILEANIVGDAIEIEGFIYAKDFPELWKAIQAEKHKLGFSYECDVRIRDLSADIWVVEHCVFTGAAILYKDKAAYHSTSLAASTAVETAMSKEILDAIAALSAGVAKVTSTVESVVADVQSLKAAKGASLAGPIIDQAMPHVGACNAAADAMEAAGIGTHPTHGHAAMLRRVGASILHCATMGKLPHIYREHSYLGGDGLEAAKDPAAEAALKAANEKAASLEAQVKSLTDTLSGINTQLADLKAAAAKKAEEPARKTSATGLALLNKFGIKAEEGKEVTVDTVDTTLAAAGVMGREAIAAKLKLRSAGAI